MTTQDSYVWRVDDVTWSSSNADSIRLDGIATVCGQSRSVRHFGAVITCKLLLLQPALLFATMRVDGC